MAILVFDRGILLYISFSFLRGGYFNSSSVDRSRGGSFWSSQASNGSVAVSLYHDSDSLTFHYSNATYGGKMLGFFVRCVGRE